MKQLTEKEWFPIRVAYGREHCTAEQLTRQGYRCWLPACARPDARHGERVLWVRSLLFVGTSQAGQALRPDASLPFRLLAAGSAQHPLSLDDAAMQRLVDAFAVGNPAQALATLFGTPGADANQQ